MPRTQILALILTSTLGTGCLEGPVVPPPPDLRGEYVLVAVDEQPVPASAPVWLVPNYTLCEPDEETEHRLTGASLQFENLIAPSFSLTYFLDWICTPPDDPEATRIVASALVQRGRYTMMMDRTVEFHIITGPPLSYVLFYTGAYHAPALRLMKEGAVLEFGPAGTP